MQRNQRNIVIVAGRCSSAHKMFGMRFERYGGNHWRATWSFPIDERAAKREGYDKTEISGAFEFAEDFPGCPHCGTGGFFRCGKCTKVACWNSASRQVKCPWCGNTGEVSGAVTSLTAGGDR